MSAAETMEDRLENQVRASVRYTASRIRRIAERLEEAAERVSVDDLSMEAVNIISWGIANAHIDGPARNLRDLHKFREVKS